MTTKNDGGQVFPATFDTLAYDGTKYRQSTGGMTLRQWYAGQALAGILGGYMANSRMSARPPEVLANMALRLADAMIAELERST